MSTIKADAITPVTGNTNLSITGSGTGVVHLGDGALKFPDADGSANQVIETDGAGQLSFVSLTSPALTFVSETDVGAGVASVDFTGLTTSDVYLFTFQHVDHDSTAILRCRLTDDAGVSWESANYATTVHQGGTAVATDGMTGNSRSTGAIDIGGSHTASTWYGGHLWLYRQGKSATGAVVTSESYGLGQSTWYETKYHGFGMLDTSTIVNGLQFLMSTGNIDDGIFRCYALADS